MPEETAIKLCPKCNTILEELDVDPEEYQKMTEGQQADYDAGSSRPFSCPKCHYYGLRDVEVFDNLPDDAYKMMDDLIDADTVEDLIIRGIQKRSFIEVISLFHNVIEEMLIMKIEDFILEIHDLDYKDLSSDDEETKIKISKLNIGHKLKVLKYNGKSKYLSDYKEMAFHLNLIDKSMFDKITKFNRLRNLAIHKLIRSDEDKGFRYRQIIEAAKLGREIHITLGPIKHSKKQVDRVLKEFDIARKEGFDDPFLNFEDE